MSQTGQRKLFFTALHALWRAAGSPTLQRIAQESNVSVSTLMGWFAEDPSKQKLPRSADALLSVVRFLKRRLVRKLPPNVTFTDDQWVALRARALKDTTEIRTDGSGDSGASGRSARAQFATVGTPLAFSGIDLGVQVLFGPLGFSWSPEDIQAAPLLNPWAAPDELRAYVKPYAEQQGQYDGSCARLSKLDVVPYSLDGGRTEQHRLRLEIAPTGYFDMLATNAALGPFTKEEAPLLTGRSGLAQTRMSNLIQIELVLITRDDYVPVFQRSSQMALLQNCWQITCGETLQLPADLAGTSGRPDVFRTALRGLDEEVGFAASLVKDLAVTAFVATPEFATVGVLMRGALDCTAMDLAQRHSQSILQARDSWEHTGRDLIPVKDPRELAEALTDRVWSKQSASALVYAHTELVDGHVEPLAQEVLARGGLKLDPGRKQPIIPSELRDELVKKYLLHDSEEP